MWPSGRCVDITHDWSSPSRHTSESSKASNVITHLEYNSSTFKSYGISFASFIPLAKKMFSPSSPIADRAQEHIYFFIYWLNKHVFPNKLKRMKLEWIRFVEALQSFDDVTTWQFILAHLYHLLHEMAKGEPFETNINGATWMMQL